MGCGSSSQQDESSKLAESTLKEAKQKNDNTVKLLLLGAGESGKSTFMKQIRAKFVSDLNPSELDEYTGVVRMNVLEFMQSMAKALNDFEMIGDLDESMQNTVKQLMELNTTNNSLLTPEFGKELSALWQTPQSQQLFQRRSEFQIVESHVRFMEQISTIASPGYAASFQDVLNSRVKTTGIRSETAMIEKTRFEIYDVGGQKSERRKWIKCFDDVTAVIFFVGLSEYDQTMLEDASENRMNDAIRLFADTMNREEFANVSVCVFLNKLDLYQEKIKRKSVGEVEYWADEFKPFAEDYKSRHASADESDLGIAFFQRKLREALPKNPDLFFRTTTATDTENILAVWEVAKAAILRQTFHDTFGI